MAKASKQDTKQPTPKQDDNTYGAIGFLKDWYMKRREQPQYKAVSEQNLKNLQDVKVNYVSPEQLSAEKAGAFYDPSTDQISIDKNSAYSNSVSTLLHEISHKLRANYPEPTETQKLKSAINPNASFMNMPDVWGHSKEYMATEAPEELHSELNKFRYNFKLDPKKQYTEEDAKSLLNLPDKNKGESFQDYKKRLDEKSKLINNHEEFLNLIGNDPKKLSELLNGIAASKTNKKENQA